MPAHQPGVLTAIWIGRVRVGQRLTSGVREHSLLRSCHLAPAAQSWKASAPALLIPPVYYPHDAAICRYHLASARIWCDPLVAGRWQCAGTGERRAGPAFQVGPTQVASSRRAEQSTRQTGSFRRRRHFRGPASGRATPRRTWIHPIRVPFHRARRGRTRPRRWPQVRCGADRRGRSPRIPGSTSTGRGCGLR